MATAAAIGKIVIMRRARRSAMLPLVRSMKSRAIVTLSGIPSIAFVLFAKPRSGWGHFLAPNRNPANQVKLMTFRIDRRSGVGSDFTTWRRHMADEGVTAPGYEACQGSLGKIDQRNINVLSGCDAG